MRSISVVFMSLLLAALAWGQLSFTSGPTLTKDGQDRFWIEFGLNQASDVAVSIVNPADSSVVRHLAAGMLGPNAPLPLVPDSLRQRLEWDGLDDLGNTVASPESLSARVRAGMGVQLRNLVGDNVYAFNTSLGGIVLGSDGSLFILGGAGQGNCYVYYLRQYDASGNYLRTVFPPPADLPRDSVTAYGVNVVPGGGWAPKTTFIPSPLIANSFINSSATKLLPIGASGELVLVNGTNTQIISESGAMADTTTKKIITAPAGPAGWSGPWGPKYFTASHSPDYLYLSGWYYAEVDGGTWLVNACDTGFWADGQVFKVDRVTGVVSPWIRLDSVPVTSADRMAVLGGGANATSAVHGVAIDDSGHVFVCDRLHQRISVYDTNAVLLGSVPCPNPDFVAVSKRTGVIYVITRRDVWNAGPMNLVKFNGWRSPAPAAATTLLTTTIQTHSGAPCMVLTEDGNTTVIWAGYYSFGVRQYRDEGASFALVRDFSQSAQGNLIYDRIAADPKTNTVFVTNSYSLVYKIEDWGNPVFVQCSTTANKPLYAGDLCVSQSGLLYIRADLRDNNAGNGSFDGPIARYDLAHRHAPVNYANTGGNISTPWLGGRYGKGWGDKGFSVSPKGIIGSLLMDGWNLYHYRTFPDTGYADTSFRGVTLVTPTGAQCGGVKFDRDGNAYLGLHVWAADRIVPGGFASDWGYSMGGAVARFAPGDTGSVSGTTVTGADKIYRQPYGAFSADGGSSCVCRSPRFELDAYGRLFMPHGATGQVTVADNAGNTILTFGQYGNTDSRGGLSGPGRLITAPDIPLAWPIAAAATEDYIFVNDWVNERLARVQMTYELDNMPGLTENVDVSAPAEAWAGLAMSSAPNPFNPVSTVRVAMPRAGRLKLEVYSMDGRFIRTVTDKVAASGVHAFTWRGTDKAGRPVSAGVYVYRVSAGKRVLTQKTVLAK
jgi:hypothetical protein